MSGLVVSDLEVRYGSVAAVRGLSLEVAPGEIVGLIGPNGAGKSSTLHAIMGLVPVAAGDVRVAGTSLRGKAPEDVARSGVALVPEGRRIFGELTVEENLRLGLSARRSKDGAGEDVERVLDLFPIVREFHARHAGALSGGQQQQLAIARALVARPDVLLLDEPSLGLVADRHRTSSSRRSRGSASRGSRSCSSSSARSAPSRSPTAPTCSRTASSASP